MLRVSSLGLRCFRHPLQPTYLRWHMQRLPSKTYSSASLQVLTSASPDHRPGANLGTTTVREASSTHAIPPRSHAPQMSKAIPDVDVFHQDEVLKPWTPFRGNRHKVFIPPLPPQSWPMCVCKGSRADHGQEGAVDSQTRGEEHVESQQAVVEGHHCHQIRLISHDVHPQDGLLDVGSEQQETGSAPSAGGSIQHPSCPREAYLHKMGATNSAESAWKCYQGILSLPNTAAHNIPFRYLHRLIRLIVTDYPDKYGHQRFFRVLSVMSQIYRLGGRLQIWQWNALINYVGRSSRRRTSLGDFETAVKIYNNLRMNRPPGTSLKLQHPLTFSPGPRFGNEHPPLKPNTVTISTLLHLASRTGEERAFRRAVKILRLSGVELSREIHLTLLSHHNRRNDLGSVKNVLVDMLRRGSALGLDGVNSCIWAFARNNSLSVAEHIFVALKGNLEETPSAEVLRSRKILENQGLFVPWDCPPDEITYTTFIQAYAYVGNLRACLATFIEMVAGFLPKERPGEKPKALDGGLVRTAYRAMFLGFARHGKDPRLSSASQAVYKTLQRRHTNGSEEPIEWDLPALQKIFDDYLGLSAEVVPSETTVYWILVGFEKTSGGDVKLLREVCSRLDKRFKPRWAGRLEVFRSKLDTDER